ncbi:MAG: GNAT family N-acetyltransferase [Deltaproteobacteria bacterium]|nr:GNAT family N-acetyltransferase [Deltaproteobacteria bacterium]MBW2662186.1 GNAT family N-acetyltransferase [Deltaproteobacteria bacterium]
MNKVGFAGYVPGAIGRVVELHGIYYHQNWGFGQFFEAKVASELSTFLDRFDKTRDGFWTACLNGRVEGSITVDGIKAESEGAHLRWFILSSKLHGRGVGNTLMEKAVNFCRKSNYCQVYLWTFAGLHAARHLYEKFGFRLVEEHKGAQWGTKVNEQKFVLNLQRKT